MLTNYDFDIVRLDQSTTGVPAQPGIHVLALFRDPDTRAAARALPEAARNWLAGAGFSFAAHRSDLPDGFYAPQDEIERLDIMRRLTATMKTCDLPTRGMAAWSDFVIAEFVDAMANARPMPLPASAALMQPRPPIPTPFTGLHGQAAKAALVKATRRRWSPRQTNTPFGMLATARRQGFLMLTLGTAFVYCAVLLYLYR